MTCTHETHDVHPFEAAGLGVAPFRFVAIERRVGPIQIGSTTIGSPGQPMGSCQYCGQGIAECCIIRDSQGAEFVVGNVCVNKTTPAESRLAKDVDRAVKAAQRKRTKARKAERIAEAVETFEANRGTFAAQAHPVKWRADQGATLADWVDWMMSNAGTAGKTRAARVVEQTLERAEKN